MLLAIAIVTGFALVLMSIVAENTVYAQWIIPWQLNGAYKQQHIEDINQTKILRAAGTTTTILHQLIKSVPGK
jgi:hypothetical protein